MQGEGQGAGQGRGRVGAREGCGEGQENGAIRGARDGKGEGGGNGEGQGRQGEGQGRGLKVRSGRYRCRSAKTVSCITRRCAAHNKDRGMSSDGLSVTAGMLLLLAACTKYNSSAFPLSMLHPTSMH